MTNPDQLDLFEVIAGDASMGLEGEDPALTILASPGPSGIVARHLMAGGSISRLSYKHIPDAHLLPKNAAIHSYVAPLRCQGFVPVEKHRRKGNVIEYSVAEADRNDFKYPKRRKVQAERVRYDVFHDRYMRVFKAFVKVIHTVRDYPDLVMTDDLCLPALKTAVNEATRNIRQIDKEKAARAKRGLTRGNTK